MSGPPAFIDAHPLQWAGVKLRLTQKIASNRLKSLDAPYTLGMVSLPSTEAANPWRELHRCEDLHQAHAVATCIAAMEFDVRLKSARAIRSGHGMDEDPDSDLPGPYVIEVPAEHWTDLAEVLKEIIAEQREFDEWIELRAQRRQLQVVLILGGAGAVGVLTIWQLLDR